MTDEVKLNGDTAEVSDLRNYKSLQRTRFPGEGFMYHLALTLFSTNEPPTPTTRMQ